LLSKRVNACGRYAVGPTPPTAHAVDPARVADTLRAFAAAAAAAAAAGMDAPAPEEGFPEPPPGEVTWAQISRGLNSAWSEALEHDAASEAGAGERRLPTLAGTCKKKDCMSFEGGVDVGRGLHVAGAMEVGGGDDVTQLRVLSAPLQTAPAVEISRGARAVLTVTAEGGVQAAGRVVAGDARDATTPADGALATRGGLGVAKGAMIGGRLRVFDDTDAATAGGGALAVVGGLHVGRSGVFGGGLQVGPGKGGPARVRVRSTDGDATLTLATAAKGRVVTHFRVSDWFHGPHWLSSEPYWLSSIGVLTVK
jgi:hypothetical protein